MSNHKFSYKWKLADGYPAPGIKYHGCRVFGTFICGGGSTMGYKLAGYDHLGGVEIDPQVASVYKANHHPKHLYIEDIRDFVKRSEPPDELFDLDLLDGSPPCSSFSMAGNREKDWGKEKTFREGQTKQRLDDLFFDYIALAKRLQPKVVIAENVKGMLAGNAKAYVKNIKTGFEDAGYKVQLFLLNAASMGVPQKRERVFFVCQRKNLKLPQLKLSFNEKPLIFGAVRGEIGNNKISNERKYLLSKAIKSDKNISHINERLYNKVSGFNAGIVHDEFVKPTITSAEIDYRYFDKMQLSEYDYKVCGTYPLDYNFQKIKPKYLIGMSVPPVMTAQIAYQIYLQWLSKTK